MNYDGDVEIALGLVDVAAGTGADAIKFQTFSAERFVTREAPEADHKKQATDASESLFEMLRQLGMPDEMRLAIVERRRDRGILFLFTPFDEVAANCVGELGVPAFKISSGDLTNLALLSHIAKKRRPMIVSTGAGNMPEIAEAVDALRINCDPGLVLLHCASDYRTAPQNVYLRAMAALSGAFSVPAGFSDHTEGIGIPLAAVALGASVVEKHFTFDRGREGPDHRASIEPDELTHLVAGIRSVEKSLGDGMKRPAGSEWNTAQVGRKSLVALYDIDAGATLGPENAGARRPAGGMPPRRIGGVIGRRTKIPIERGTLVDPEMLQ